MGSMQQGKGRTTRAQVPVYRAPDGRIVHGRSVGLRELEQRQRQGSWLNLLFFLAIVAGAVGLVSGFEVAHANAIYPGVRVGGVDVGGLTPAQAEARLQGVTTGLAG